MTGRLAIALTVLVIGLAACGDSDDSEDGGGATPTTVESQAATDEPVLIVVRYDLPNGEVLPESRIGDSPFCPGGTTPTSTAVPTASGWWSRPSIAPTAN